MSSIVRKAALVASVLVLVPLTQPAPGSAAGRAYVRVNQVGYVQDGPKQAFLLSTQDHEGEPFDLVGDGGVVAFSGTIGADRGAWNDRYGHVNQIDFDAFANPGVYVLEAAGATSPPFEIGSGVRGLRPPPFERARVLPRAARRSSRRPGVAGPQALPSERRARDGVRDPRLRERASVAASGADRHGRRRGRMVRRRRLHQVRAYGRVRRSAHAARAPRRREPVHERRPELPRRGEVRPAVAAEDDRREPRRRVLPGRGSGTVAWATTPTTTCGGSPRSTTR